MDSLVVISGFPIWTAKRNLQQNQVVIYIYVYSPLNTFKPKDLAPHFHGSTLWCRSFGRDIASRLWRTRPPRVRSNKPGVNWGESWRILVNVGECMLM
jgi:hypothetical protein